MTKKSFVFIAIVFISIIVVTSFMKSKENTTPSNSTKAKKSVLPEGFVYISDVDPTILYNVRYASKDNFEGRPVAGYHKPTIILTEKAALQLKKVQDRVRQDGYSLVVYDAYRPQKAVDDFMVWSNHAEDQACKKLFYPRINKKDVFELGYVAKKSGHSRGSTVDLTLIPLGHAPHPIHPEDRAMNGGIHLLFLDDGTLDMGSSFDLFDEASHYENTLIRPEHQKRRKYLKDVMDQYGFTNYAEEWWHFTLRNEPYPDTYFDFDIM